MTWNWGNFVQTVINFFIISGCVFILVKGETHKDMLPNSIVRADLNHWDILSGQRFIHHSSPPPLPFPFYNSVRGEQEVQEGGD